MGDRYDPNRRKYLSAIGGTLGFLALPSQASAEDSNKNNNPNSQSKNMASNPKKPDSNFDPHNINDVRGVNIAMRHMNENALEKWVKELSDKQKEAIVDSNKVTMTVLKHKMTIGGEERTINIEIENDDSIAKKWGWEK